MTDIMSKEKRSEVMSKIRGTNTKIELAIRHELWNRGLRGYRLHYKVAGKPDIVFPKQRVAIFCDGTFWHGKNFKKWRHKLQPSWAKKISDNIKRDKTNRQKLRKAGWSVLQFWEDSIERDTKKCVSEIEEVLKELDSDDNT
jgi:DNA mismatch endonuclease (patch repair protein)